MTALFVVGHGTRDDEGVRAYLAFVDRLRARAAADASLGIPAVEGGFIELSPPPVTDAVARLAEAGHRHFAAVPLMLVAAGHAKGDVPAALQREARRQGVTYVYGRPLGTHPTIVRLLDERLSQVLADDERAGTAVLLVGRGSTDPDANSEVVKAARLFWEGRGELAFTETAFVSLAAPDVAAGLERCRLLGARRIVVLPYFLFPGVLPDRVAAQARAWAQEHTDLDVRCADVIGDCDALADLVLERHAEALGGDIRMNCDSCVYRIALPGFEHRVGQEQTPHDHPHDPTDPHGHHHHAHH